MSRPAVVANPQSTSRIAASAPRPRLSFLAMAPAGNRAAFFGGAYANPPALRAVLEDAASSGAESIFNLGDLGGFGADVNGLWPLLEEYGVRSIAGNYDVALGFGRSDCGCGYTDPDDQREADVIFEYTSATVDPDFAAWMRTLPTELRLPIGGQDVLLVHGSPLELNEFLWESRSDEELRERLDAVAGGRPEVMLCTHTGLPWQRRVDGTLIVNVGAVGKPANNGSTDATYALLDLAPDDVVAELRAVAYDWRAQAGQIRASALPDECAEVIETGWWSSTRTLPALERARSERLRAEAGR